MSDIAPKISVVMSVYNGDRYLSQAVDSILGQTYENFEFIIIDDGSDDDTKKILESYNDKRIKIKSRANKGMPVSLNEAISLANGKYIARQDSDDISLPERLQKQISHLESHPEIGLLGSNIEVIDEQDERVDKKIANVDLLTAPDDLKLAEVFSNQFAHGTVVVRRSILDKVGLYDPKVPISEDYDLWTRVSRVSVVANLKEPLYKWRLHSTNISTGHATAARVKNSALQTAAREFDYYAEHKKEYPFFSFHPFSMKGGVKSYLLRKSAVYRDMAVMYSRHGHRRKSLPILLLAIMHAPWLVTNYRHFFTTLTNHAKALGLEYELF